MSMRVFECNVCGEPLTAANDEELLRRVRAHFEAEHPDAPFDEAAERETIAQRGLRRDRQLGAADPVPGNIVVVRHGETEWSLSGKHTSRTDLPLTEAGRERAAKLPAVLRGSRRSSLVLSSPLRRARETCSLAGLRRPRR